MGKPSLRNRIAARLWNLRFHLGWRLLPGDHKHVSLLLAGEHCSRCRMVVS